MTTEESPGRFPPTPPIVAIGRRSQAIEAAARWLLRCLDDRSGALTVEQARETLREAIATGWIE